jgi:DNA-binding XRE family transcriptional regulator
MSTGREPASARTERAKARTALRAKRSKERRAALRDELYERIASGTISIPEAVRTMRKITGRSQIDYARLVGVSPRVLIELERGFGNPTLKTLDKIVAPFDLETGLKRRAK